MGAGFATPLRSMVLAWLMVPPPVKSTSATNGLTAGPPELICTVVGEAAGVVAPAWFEGAEALPEFAASTK